ncbi:MAG: hypothetical protein J6A22_07325, partial [Bacteroidales bacterium]|nr:hypothetical protein [Bacteroidales bacterium]
SDDVDEDVLCYLFRVFQYRENEVSLYLCRAVMVFLGKSEYYFPYKIKEELEWEVRSERIKRINHDDMEEIEGYWVIHEELYRFFSGNENGPFGVDEDINYLSDCWYIQDKEKQMLLGRKKGSIRLLNDMEEEVNEEDIRELNDMVEEDGANMQRKLNWQTGVSGEYGSATDPQNENNNVSAAYNCISYLSMK